jgi:hypothetical protein
MAGSHGWRERGPDAAQRLGDGCRPIRGGGATAPLAPSDLRVVK